VLDYITPLHLITTTTTTTTTTTSTNTTIVVTVATFESKVVLGSNISPETYYPN